MTEFLLFLIFLAPTIQYRVELQAFSFAIMEPVVLLASGILVLRALSRKEAFQIPRTWPEIGLIGLVAWAILIRPWSQDWKHGLSDIRDWVIPVVTFLTLRMTIRRDWRRAIEMVVAVVSLTAMVGVYQGITGNLRPFISPEANLKLAPGSVAPQGVGWDPASGLSVWQFYAQQARLSEQGLLPTDKALETAESQVAPPFAVGFFAHPNSMGMFLTAGFLLVLGWAIEIRRPEGWLVLGLAGLALALTYAKTSYVVLAGELIALFLVRRIRSLKVLAAMTLASVVAALLLLSKLPASVIGSLAWRYGLWTTAFHLVASSPLILLFGNGMDPYGNVAYYFQPHNSFIYLLLEFGLLGLCLILGVLACVAVKGWQDGSDGLWEQSWILPVLWIAALGFFAIGLTESVLLGIESRMIVLSFFACYLGLRRDLRAARPTLERHAL